ncbi:MAG: nickel-dependent lactate racemase, partial [Spirochaetes bacterium]
SIMQDIRLPYGESSLNIHLPNNLKIEIVKPKYIPGLKNQKNAVTAALRNPIGVPPLSDLVKPSSKVGIVFSDITRATPYNRILPALLDELKAVPDGQITLFNATGTHRQNTREELYKILSEETANRFKIIQNNALDKKSHIYLGTTKRGTRISVLRDFMDCDIRILTGFIEPHFFAGFSGGGKAAIPGLASMETVLANHSVKNIDDPKANWGITENNPVWEDIMEAAEMCMPLFLINVALNRDKEITGAFLKVSHSIEETIEELLDRYGNNASVYILPEGPMTIPYIQ